MGYAALGHMQPVGCRLTSIWQRAMMQTLGQHMAGHVQHQQHLAVQPLSTNLGHHSAAQGLYHYQMEQQVAGPPMWALNTAGIR